LDSFAVSKKELTIIEYQLGRPVNNVVEVVKRCSYGYPQVIQSYPLKDNKPFPTLYWLTCPFLVEKVSKLESEQKIREFEKNIQEDNKLKIKLLLVHKQEIEKRLKLLGNKIDELPQSMTFVLKETGIGGTKNFSNLKCLHLHYASFLAGEDNPIGKMVNDDILDYECSDIRCDIRGDTKN